MNGSSSQHNAEGQTAALSWPNVSFPRFFYGVLRGLSALVKWATVQERAVPIAALAPALAHLALAFPDGVVRARHQAFIDTGTRLHVDGRWRRQSRALSAFSYSRRRACSARRPRP
ncbi:MAG: hypothetical protein IPM79_37800 [Polyangiaceae bacterium]|nr:hypothetical protein [Polyangiaceae bacterium]